MTQGQGGRHILSARHAAAVVAGVTVVTLLVVPVAAQAHPRRPRAARQSTYYVSLGDSYAVGDQPNPKNLPSEAGPTAGYTAYVAKKEKLALVNFGCGRETSAAILTYIGRCVIDPGPAQYGPAAATDVGPGVTYGGETQAQDALSFIDAHVGHIGLITVAVGASDILPCIGATDPQSCIEGASSVLEGNVATLVRELRAAAGADVPIVGLSYPDFLLGSWVYPEASPNLSLATQSVGDFDTVMNEALSAAYAKGGSDSAFLDVTSAPWESATSGDDTSLADTTIMKGYGTIPDAVAEICQLTYYCSKGNYRANAKGYDFIGGLVVNEYVSMQHG